MYTHTVHRAIQNKQYIEKHNNFGRVRAVPGLGYNIYPEECKHAFQIISEFCVCVCVCLCMCACVPQLHYSSVNGCSSQRNVPRSPDHERNRVLVRSLGTRMTPSTFSIYLLLVDVSVVTIATYFAAGCRRYRTVFSIYSARLALVSRGFSISGAFLSR